MNSPITSSAVPSALVPAPTLIDIVALRTCGIFPINNEPSIRTLREWTRRRRIPHHRVGHFVYYDPAEVSHHIRTKLKIPARG